MLKKKRKVYISQLSLCNKPLQTYSCKTRIYLRKNSVVNNLGWIHLGISLVSVEGPHASTFGCGLALLILAGLLYMFGDLSWDKRTGQTQTHMVSHSLAGQCGLIPWQSRGSKRMSRSPRVLLGPRLGTITVPFSLPSMAQSKEQGQPRFQEQRNRFHFSCEKLQSHIAKGRGNRERKNSGQFCKQLITVCLTQKPESCHHSWGWSPYVGHCTCDTRC